MTLHNVRGLTDGISRATHSSFEAERSHHTQGLYEAFFKRALDISLVLISLPIVLPLILFLILVVGLCGGTPLYSQLRVGRHEENFRIWKMRTMVAGADEKLFTYLSKNSVARSEWNATQKLKNDPRITPLGRFLRRTSLDELPQLWNVLNGTMSLVGPRPMMVSQKSFYTGLAYSQLRPGITGLWQVSDRNNCTFEQRIIYDEEYKRSMSFTTDIRLLWKTASVVINSTGH